MTQTIDLKKLERKAYRSTFQDGLWDIMLGLIILALGVIPLLTELKLGDFWSSMLLIPFYLFGYFIFTQGKRRFTIPRMGMIKFGPMRKKKRRKIILFLMAALLIGLLAGVIFLKIILMADWLPVAFLMVLIFVSFNLGAHYLDFSRLTVYGAILTLFVPLGEILFRKGFLSHHGFPMIFGTSGILMIVTGIVLFIRFLRKYPLPTEEVLHGE